MDRPIALACALCVLLLADTALANRTNRIGVRGGNSITSSGRDFDQMELFAIHHFEWDPPLPGRWTLGAAINESIGLLRGEGDEAYIFTAGPRFSLSRRGWRLALNFGSSITIVSEEDFGAFDTGSAFHFTTHVGGSYRLHPLVTFSYRYHHMSNANLGDPNPGLNIHMVGVAYDF